MIPAQTSGKAAFRQTLLDERSRELAFAGFRNLDLLRWGTLISTMQNMVRLINSQAPTASNNTFGNAGRTKLLVPYSNFTPIDTLFAIPTIELSLNPAMTQNPRW